MNFADLFHTAPTEIVPTPDLQAGDLVLAHGWLLQLGERKVSSAHQPNEYGEVVYFSTTRLYDSGAIGPDSDVAGLRYTVQGNRLARWQRVAIANAEGVA